MSAEALVAETADVARGGKTWKAEGYAVTKDAAGKLGAPEEFKITYQVSAPARARLEITTGASPLLRVCDGTSQWTYYPKINSYIRVPKSHHALIQ